MTDVEPQPCFDCGVDTTPCTGRRGCRHKGRWEYYMVHDRLWAKAGMATSRMVCSAEVRLGRRISVEEATAMSAGFLCVGCLERRLGRALRPNDFTAYHINRPKPWDTPALAVRKGHTS